MTDEFEEIYFIYNARSTSFLRSKKFAHEIKKIFKKSRFDELELFTKSNSEKALIKYARNFDSKTLVLIGGGDGTVNFVFKTILKSRNLTDENKQAVFLPLWGGNANDISVMLNGLATGTNIKKLINSASITKIHPIEATFNPDKGKKFSELGFGYIGFGMTAHAISAIEKSFDRSKVRSVILLPFRFIGELLHVLRVIIEAKPFMIEGENEEAQEVDEKIFINGSRIAKIDRFPAEISNLEFYEATSPKNKFHLNIFQSLFNRHPGKVTNKPSNFKINSKTLCQVDGEVVGIKKDTLVEVSIYPKPIYVLSRKFLSSEEKENKEKKRSKKYKIFKTLGITSLILIIFHGYLHITNPYANFNIVKQPYTTSVEQNGEILYQKNFELKVYDNLFMNLLGYYKSGFLIVQNKFFGGNEVSGETPDEIISNIHKARFDPSRPYLITGDQFSVLYIRNLGVFYNKLLEPNTAINQEDWENRQRIYLQSVLYGLDTLIKADKINTTSVPISPSSTIFTSVHPGSIGSDTVYGLFYALDKLSQSNTSDNGEFKIGTVNATNDLIKSRRADLAKIYNRYISEVADGDFAKAGLHLSGARDGVNRSQSFYDSLVLWKTREIAQRLGISNESKESIKEARSTLLKSYWSDETGCFRDELNKPDSYSSDWLLVGPTDFLNYEDDRDLYKSCINYIERNSLDQPLPIKYSGRADNVPWAVETFVPNYGSDAIWSYWGAEYITALAKLADDSKDGKQYKERAKNQLKAWEQKIIDTSGFPETLDPKGNFLRTKFYKSIRSTGWVVQFEYAKYLLGRNK